MFIQFAALTILFTLTTDYRHENFIPCIESLVYFHEHAIIFTQGHWDIQYQGTQAAGDLAAAAPHAVSGCCHLWKQGTSLKISTINWQHVWAWVLQTCTAAPKKKTKKGGWVRDIQAPVSLDVHGRAVEAVLYIHGHYAMVGDSRTVRGWLLLDCYTMYLKKQHMYF